MPYLLLLRSLTPPEIAPVQRAFQSTGIFHTLDAVSFVKNAFGVLAKGLEAEPAQQLQRALATEGVEADIVADSEWPVLPPAKRIVQASCWAEGFEPLDPLGRPLHVPWDQVVAVSAGLVLREETGTREVVPFKPLSNEARTLLDGAATIWDLMDADIESVLIEAVLPSDKDPEPSNPMEPILLPRVEQNWRWCAEITLAGGVRLVWQAHEFQFASLSDRLSNDPAVNFSTFLRDLLSAVPNALLNRGALAVRENQAETGPRYPTQKAFDQETQWLLWRLRGASPLTGAALALDAP